MEASTDLFINIIRNHRIIYDNKSKDFKNIHKKEDAWAEIAEESGMSVESAKKRYASLRQKYCREKKKELLCVRQKKTFRPCVFFDRLSFLDEFIKPRRTFTNDVELMDDETVEGDEENIPDNQEENTETTFDESCTYSRIDGLIGDELSFPLSLEPRFHLLSEYDMPTDPIDGYSLSDEVISDMQIDAGRDGLSENVNNSVEIEVLDVTTILPPRISTNMQTTGTGQQTTETDEQNEYVSDEHSSSTTSLLRETLRLASQLAVPDQTSKMPTQIHLNKNLSHDSSYAEGSNVHSTEDTPISQRQTSNKARMEPRMRLPFVEGGNVHSTEDTSMSQRQTSDITRMEPPKSLPPMYASRHQMNSQNDPNSSRASDYIVGGNVHSNKNTSDTSSSQKHFLNNTPQNRRTIDNHQNLQKASPNLRGLSHIGNDTSSCRARANLQVTSSALTKNSPLVQATVAARQVEKSTAKSGSTGKTNTVDMDAIKQKMESYLTACNNKLSKKSERSPHASFLSYLGTKMEKVPKEKLVMLEQEILNVVFRFSD